MDSYRSSEDTHFKPSWTGDWFLANTFRATDWFKPEESYNDFSTLEIIKCYIIVSFSSDTS